MKNKLLILLSLLYFMVEGQTVIFEEDFEDEAIGATTGVSAEGLNWTTICPGCDPTEDAFEVSIEDPAGDGMNMQGLFGNDTNGPATLSVSGIDAAEDSCFLITFDVTYESQSFIGSGNLECASECGSCPGDVNNPLQGSCNNCWDFLYAEIVNESSGDFVRELLLGEDCDYDGATASRTSDPLCVSPANPDGSDTGNDPSNISLNIVMSMWASEEEMIVDDIIVTCYTFQEAIDNDLDTVGCYLLPHANTEFTARQQQNSAVLRWSSSHSERLSYYEVERSYNAYDWKVIGRQLASEPEDALTEHVFVDQSPMVGNNYYRLRIMHEDGQAEFSETKLVRFQEMNTNASLLITPDYQLRMHLPEGLSAELRIIGVNGKVYETYHLLGREQSMMLADLPSGLYFAYAVLSDGSTVVRRFVR